MNERETRTRMRMIDRIQWEERQGKNERGEERESAKTKPTNDEQK